MKTKAKYGWRRDLPDHRDYLYRTFLKVENLPPRVDLRLAFKWPAVMNQGNIGSCTAQAIAAAHLFNQMKQGDPTPTNPSRLFIYYNERAIEQSIAVDAGAAIRDGIKTIARQGVCDELLWPYVPSRFAQKPTRACYVDALKHQAIGYQRVPQVLVQMKDCLASGFPFVFGFSVFSSFESSLVTRTGIVPMPSYNEEALGGHAVICYGYDDAMRRFKIMNSWGLRWGKQGFFTMPYEYLANYDLAADFWTIRNVEIV